MFRDLPDGVYWCDVHHVEHGDVCDQCEARFDALHEAATDHELADCAGCGVRCEPAPNAQGWAPICADCAARERAAFDEAHGLEAAE